MAKAHPAELVLGSVQLGLGVRPPKPAALRKVETGNEERPGDALRVRHAVRTITNLNPLYGLAPDASRETVRKAIDESIAQSLAAEKRDRLDCLLLTRASLMSVYDGAVWERVNERLEDGTVLALGVSVQSPQEALAALEHEEVRHLQMPFNILDWRWYEAGVTDRIRVRGDLTVHVKGVFLQGLLAANEPAMWPPIRGLDARAMVKSLQGLAKQFRRENVADLCVAYARGQDWVDGVVLGSETEEQLDTNLRLFLRNPLSPADCAKIEETVPRVPAQLLDPARWPRLF